MPVIFLLVSFFSSLVGAICGIGGGVIIKPVLDATGTMSVTAISFLSGCTVLSMSIISVAKAIKNTTIKINTRITTWLALGSVLGGMSGKVMFQTVKEILQNENKTGAVQSIVMIFITLGTLIYTAKKSQIKTHHFKNKFLCFVIGVILGIFSSFLGIGGGPINLVILIFFFSMTTKEAAINSIYIILFSQIASLLHTIFARKIPDVSILYLGLMVLGGVCGGMAGSIVNKKILEEKVDKLFMGLMLVIVFINIYNAYVFMK
ncbi:sulfite exporter TauE/SafE family protein [uncultured Fusobacterium sp.]|uniref:sulfite exporter TauE/SafE family protein n=1 Tax=uncultured Fusobacterium sp. TaxID=159267 RepID=UPI00259ACEE6|nr:sulfite exporter TauE/SafE family protein [uncultured Fusobacterium sp.]